MSTPHIERRSGMSIHLGKNRKFNIVEALEGEIPTVQSENEKSSSSSGVKTEGISETNSSNNHD